MPTNCGSCLDCADANSSQGEIRLIVVFGCLDERMRAGNEDAHERIAHIITPTFHFGLDFLRSIPNLVYQYESYANFKADSLG